MFGELISWGLFPSYSGNKYILVTVDYVSKCVEAQAFPINDAKTMVKFLKRLFTRFGTPRIVISDRGTHFYNTQIEKVLKHYGMHHHLYTPYHP